MFGETIFERLRVQNAQFDADVAFTRLVHELVHVTTEAKVGVNREDVGVGQPGSHGWERGGNNGVFLLSKGVCLTVFVVSW